MRAPLHSKGTQITQENPLGGQASSVPEKFRARHFPGLHITKSCNGKDLYKERSRSPHIKRVCRGGGCSYLLNKMGAGFKNDQWQVPRGPQGGWKAFSLLQKPASNSARTISGGTKALLGSIGLQSGFPKHHLSYKLASCQTR